MDTEVAIVPTIDAEIVSEDNQEIGESNLVKRNAYHGFTDEQALIKGWLAERSPATQKTYQGIINEFYDAGFSINASFSELQSYKHSLAEKHKITTANKKLSAIRSLIKFAFEMGYISQNAATVLKTIKTSKDKTKQSKAVVERILSVDEVTQLFNAASNDRDRAMIKTAYILGLRIHELLNLHWQDFSHRSDGKWQVKVIGKCSKERFITVPQYLYDELKALETTGYIFLTYLVNQLSAMTAHKMLKKCAKKAGLGNNASWHWLRHSCASHSLLNGASLESVRKKLGHSSIAITSVYIHDDVDASDFIRL